MSAAAEGFLDQLITWRELGYQFCHAEPRYDRFDTLPDWAKRTLAAHRGDPRPVTYDLATFEQAATHDPLWNAAQTQLVTEGTIHNYLRMLWGKKVLHWTRTPEEALSILIHLNNKYALDGRDPNSYSGIFWVFGRFDRAFGPERPVFGTVRYMTSRSTATKYRVKGYLARHGGAPAQGRLALD
ncbi:MAG: deoxyribodipyrimidine photolyase, partial [Myxococcales bacterium]|nr:deoxyribodipyrimidine photolyase [Myxococcales bacterium]